MMEADHEVSQLRELLNQVLQALGQTDMRATFRDLLRCKVELLVADCTALSGDTYETNDAREVAFVLRHLFTASAYSAIDVSIYSAKRLGAVLSQESIGDTLVSLSAQAASSGRSVRILFVQEDWLAAIADSDCARVVKSFLLHNAQVRLLQDGKETMDSPPILSAVFSGPQGFSTVCRLLGVEDRNQSCPLLVSYAKTEVKAYAAWFRSMWASPLIRTAKLL